MKSVKRIPFDLEKAKAGAQVVTRDGHKVDTIRFDGRDSYPISGWIRALRLIDDSDEYASFTEEGYYISSNNEDCRDLFIEVEESEKQLLPFDLEKAKAGAKIVTRNGLSVRIVDYKVNDKDYPVLGLVAIEGIENPYKFTINGKFYINKDYELDLFIEEEAEEEHNNFEIMPDKWYLCTNAVCLWLKSGKYWFNFIKGVPYLGADILEYRLKSEYCQEFFRPWTIQDAKPGDVLASMNGRNILIFKQIETITSFSSYYNIQQRREDSWANYCFIPATQEQRNFLFQKMKETGYEWDSDRMELKLIENEAVDDNDDKAETEVKKRRMTNQELADWLRKCPEEFREFTFRGNTLLKDGLVYFYYDYLESEADKPVDTDKLIRRNHGEWQEPLIEE